MASNGKISKIIVVGAGPAGMLLTLMLSKQEINVQLLESSDKISSQPRAAYYGLPAAYELRRAGIAEDVSNIGFLPKRVCWRKPNGVRIAGLKGDDIDESYPDKMLCLPLDRLCGILERHIKEQATAEICWNCKVVKVGQDEDKAWVDVETPEGEKRLEADYIAGCDGATSQVRRCILGDRSFPGSTWEKQIIATNVRYNFKQFGWEDTNFIIHPTNFFMAAKLDDIDLWRVTYGEVGGSSIEEYRARQPDRFKQMLPGNPSPGEYQLLNISPYKMHQRCAEKFRVDRVVLAADAAHVCNPWGGLGLTGGLVDVGGLVDCLVGIHEGKANPDILDKYSSERKRIWHEIIDPISTDNFKRMFGHDPETALETDEFLQMCVRADTDKEFSVELQMGANLLRHDFTQYYHSQPSKQISEGREGIIPNGSVPNGTTKSTGRSLRDRKKVDYKEDQTSGRSEANRLAKREVTRKRREKAKAKRKKGKNDAWEKMMGVK